tara:strand:+ start:332 stop:742 length:411 start_codon:yes stop_codon:yes gene_type:complete
MGFINLGTVTSTILPYVVNYSDIRTVNCDDIIKVEAEIIGTGSVIKVLNIRITYKFSQESTFLVVQKITYTTSGVLQSFEFTAAQYAVLFTRAVSSVSNTLSTINAPQVNQFLTGFPGSQLVPLDGSRSFEKLLIS